MILWTVYGVIDPETSHIVYVGISKDPCKRLRQHHSNSRSAIYEWLQENQSATLCFFGSFRSKKLALIVEGRLISTLPSIYNNTHNAAAEEFWLPIRNLELTLIV